MGGFHGGDATALRCALIAVLCGCSTGVDPGDGDPGLALWLAYADDGTPAFAGQALLHQSCADASACHGVETGRFAAGPDLLFDLSVQSWTSNESEAAVAAQGRLLERADRVYAVVLADTPHPDAERLAAYRELDPEGYSWRRRDGDPSSTLPAIDSAIGREVLRNWLASGAPVVQGVRPERYPVGGWVTPVCVEPCAEPTWPSVYEHVLRRRCATSGCHSAGEAAGDLDFESGEAAGVYARLVEGRGGTACFGNDIRIIAPDAGGEELLLRSNDWHCRIPGRSPPARWTREEACALDGWISCGACESPGDPACEGCEARAREACGVEVDADGVLQCVSNRCAIRIPRDE